MATLEQLDSWGDLQALDAYGNLEALDALVLHSGAATAAIALTASAHISGVQNGAATASINLTAAGVAAQSLCRRRFSLNRIHVERVGAASLRCVR
jgi:hypothetical protein